MTKTEKGFSRSLGDQAVRGSGIVLLSQAVRVALQFISLVVLARLLSPKDFGLVAMVISVVGVADLLRDFGLSAAAVQARTVSGEERTNLFWVNAALGAACTVVISACAPLIQDLYDEPALVSIVLALAWTFFLSGLNTQFRADLTREMRYFPLAATDVLAQTTALVVAIGCAVAGLGVWSLVAQQLTQAGLTLLGNGLFAQWVPGLPRRGVSLRRFYRFGGNLLATQLLTYLTKNVDNIALGIVRGPVQLGYYSRAYQLLMAPLNQINAPLTGVALPVLSRVQDDLQRLQHYLARAQLVGCYVTATVFAVAAGLSEPLILLLFGDRWAPTAPIFGVLAVGGIFRSIQQVAYWTYLASGHTGAQLRMILLTRPLMIVLMLAGLPWGPMGVAVGHSVGFAMFWWISTLHAGRVTGVASRLLLVNGIRTVLLVGAPAGVVAWTATLVDIGTIAQLGAGAIGATAYLVLITVLNQRVGDDVRMLHSFLRRALRRS